MAALTPRLTAAGYEVEQRTRGGEAVVRLRGGGIDLLIIDGALPDLSGLAICRLVRRRSTMAALPIILLAADTGEQDRVRALDAGADDLVIKPFSILELLARVNAVLRRASKPLPNQVEMIGTIEINRGSRRVSRNGREVRLGLLEYGLLSLLMQRPGQVFTRAQLLDAIWPKGKRVGSRTVDVQLGRLRRVLSVDGEPDPIVTVRGEGYVFDKDFGIRR